jgi:hypothetical protein
MESEAVSVHVDWVVCIEYGQRNCLVKGPFSKCEASRRKKVCELTNRRIRKVERNWVQSCHLRGRVNLWNGEALTGWFREQSWGRGWRRGVGKQVNNILGFLCYSEVGGSRFLWNVSSLLLDYKIAGNSNLHFHCCENLRCCRDLVHVPRSFLFLWFCYLTWWQMSG